MNYKMIIEYDGTRYEGWQKQKHSDETLQGKIEKAFEKVIGENVQIIGAGRTDSGVHAKGQVANVHLPYDLNAENLKNELNEILPDDIYIKQCTEVEEKFHSRFHAKSKIYEYNLRIGSNKDVFQKRFIWQFAKPLCIEKMKRAAEILQGTHDFTAFCNNKHFKKSAVRTVYSIEISTSNDILHLRFCGDGFLQGMIRIMVGTLVEVGENKRDADSLYDVLKSKQRSNAGFTAPPQGLTLISVQY
ncbi:tRNA pseudouridine(38-40) synthase TruA [Dialister micraerophilus]|uniref:tRNA pseudouridine(38-40) synthase TruA n=1 Tax=Dialister micraerophilus TaxID=309120 RepID=UPI0023EFB35A|nr:tRNA pseudouridine(38-40) synthase TruA [Dialister micraerophilus]MDK8253101.1 tRNA pseudouridine(38-40) synthase TruA [Dialister micraerophilus]MDK8285462.1 tRNA pseudouridine(38-40) synthase TruA [Dialister micraerophilus]